MKPLQRIFIFVILLCCSLNSFAQVSKDAAVQIEVSIGKNPDNLTLRWPADVYATGYDVYRRNLGSTSWGASKKHLAGTITQYTDSSAVIGKVYEYRVKKTATVPLSGSLNGAYHYKITFVTAVGETPGGAASAVVNPSYGQVVLSAIPKGPQGVIGRRIYRTLAGGAVGKEKLVDTLPNNTTTSYLDNIADGALRDTIPLTGIAMSPPGAPTASVAFVNITSYGYTESAIEAPMVADHGKIILLVDKTFSDSLKTELARLEDDLWREGWHVIRHDVARNALVPDVKALVVADHTSDPDNTKALFIFGHVPVPYSGDINPDGHPDHKGAWPADIYYGEFNADWTDDQDFPISGIRPVNQNIAGDGKFDISALSEIGSTVDLMIGRVDLSNMPSFSKSEGQLLKQYLDKDHNFRTGVLTAPVRALVDDNFGFFGGEAFASNAWRNLPPLVSIDSMKQLDWFSTLGTQPFLWAYGTGGGYDNSAGGIGTTTDFAMKESKAIFTMMFGSYFGDWNLTDNFLRAPLCSSYGLTCAWAGRPYWSVFPMGLGEPIGYCTKLTQNNTGDYVISPTNVTNWVHVALMGDPTLVMHPVVGPGPLTVSDNAPNNQALLQWQASPDKNVIGYYIFRASSKFGNYYLLNPSLVTNLSYTDIRPIPDSAYYFVRAVKLETTPSGSYYNLSPGVNGVSKGLKGYGVLAENKEKESLNIINRTGGVEIILEKTYTSQVKLEIYDASGKAVRQLNNGTLSPGTYRYDWQTSSVASGVYFVSAIGLKEPLTAKIIVLQ